MPSVILSALELFLRARSVKWTLLAVLAVTALGFLIGNATLRILNGSGQGVPWAVLVPCLFAVIISVGQHTEMAGAEHLSCRWIGGYRATYIGVLTLIAGLATYIIAVRVPGPIGALAALRNLLALEGVALTSSTLTEHRLTWVLPALWTFMTMSFGSGHDGQAKWWALPIMPNDPHHAVYLATVLFAFGVTVAASSRHAANTATP